MEQKRMRQALLLYYGNRMVEAPMPERRMITRRILLHTAILHRPSAERLFRFLADSKTPAALDLLNRLSQ